MTSRFAPLALVTCLFAAQAVGQPTGPWPMFRADGLHSGRSQSVGPHFPSPQWNLALESRTYSSPAVGTDRTLYLGSFEALYAVTAAGTVRWTTPVNDFTIASPALGADGTVYVGATDGTLYALDAQTGAARWTFAAGDEIWSSPTIGPDGTVYIGTSDGFFYALRPGATLPPGTPRVRWRYTAPGEIAATPAIGPDGSIYVAALNGTLHVLAPGDGARLRSLSVPAEVVSSPALGSDGTLYVGGRDGVLYAFAPSGTAPRWTARLGGELISSPAVATDGTIYIGSTDGSLYAVRPDGTRRWAAPLDGEVYASPALDAGGSVFVGTVRDDGGTLYGLNAATGTVRWSQPAETALWSSPSLGPDGTLYVASAGDDAQPGRLYSIEGIAFTIDFSTEPTAGVSQTVVVSAPVSFRPTTGTLFFRRGGERRYQSEPLAGLNTSSYEALIPAEYVTPRGLEYYVSLSDGRQTQTFPTSAPEVQPAVRQVRIQELEYPLPLLPARYSMVSVPIELADPSPAAVLVDDLGAYGPTTWRLFAWRNNRFEEYPNLSTGFTPGNAFFLATRRGRSFDVGGGRSVSTATPYAVTLRPGWNQVAVPFAFPVDWNAVTVRDPRDAGAIREIAFYDGREMLQNVAAFNPLQPWAGYFVRNGLDRPVAIIFPNVEADAAAKGGPPPTPVDVAETDYVLHLAARALGAPLQDTQNWLGFLRGAHAGADGFNLAEAPPFGDHLRLSIVEADARYAGLFQPTDGPGYRWTLELEIAPARRHADWVEVSLAAIGRLPDGYGLHVIDEDLGQTVAVIEDRFRIEVGGDRPVRRLSLVLGTEAFSAESLSGISTHPSAFFLDQNHPNPFNPETQILYSMEQPAHVVLEVYNVTGQRVATLVNESRPAGRHTVSWNGRDDAGHTVASGLYFYRLRTGTFSATRKMLLLR